MEPKIVTIDLTNSKLYHQRQYLFLNGGNKHYYHFAYLSKDRPYYSDNDHLNTYVYTVKDLIPNMIVLDDDFWPEDLYQWVSQKIAQPIEQDAYVLNQHIIDLGYNGWFNTQNNEYVISSNIIDHHLKFWNQTIRNNQLPDQESHGHYYI